MVSSKISKKRRTQIFAKEFNCLNYAVSIIFHLHSTLRPLQSERYLQSRCMKLLLTKCLSLKSELQLRKSYVSSLKRSFSLWVISNKTLFIFVI